MKVHWVWVLGGVAVGYWVLPRVLMATKGTTAKGATG